MLMAIDEKLTRIDGPAGGRLRGRRILLAGGAAGIGLETARAALREGAAVALIDRRPDALASAKGHRQGKGGGEVQGPGADCSAASRAGDSDASGGAETGGHRQGTWHQQSVGVQGAQGCIRDKAETAEARS
jgi:NAD(P)-dependent dehydrogenase (short-subunit alcohol dehydrogenase family)